MADSAYTPEEFKDIATSPRRMTGDEGTVEERSVDDMRKAVQYQDGATAAKSPPHGMYVSKLSQGSIY